MNSRAFLEMIAKGRTYKVTDIHLSADEFPVFRVNDRLYRFEEYPKIKSEDLKLLVSELITEEEREILENKKELDFSYDDLGGNCRINVFYEREEIAFAIRIINKEVLTLEELNLSAKINDFYDDARGLIIICGKSRSGKTTTVAGMIEKYNKEKAYNIITIEDPIEYFYKNEKSIIRQREVGRDVKSYTDGIKSALRQNADIIMLGELRDTETVEMALLAAETGHTVLATFNSSGIIDSIDRIIGMFSEDRREYIQRLVAANLVGVIHQEFTEGIDNDNNPIKVPICEIMYTNNGIQNLIKNGKISQISSFLDVSGRKGILNKQESIKELYRNKRLTSEQFEKEIKELRKF